MTKAEYATHEIRERIRSGELRPGERLAVERLKVELRMSPTPIREALRVLQTEGLVEYVPHRGIFVTKLSVDDVEEIFRLRVVLEPLAVERAIEFMDDATWAEIESVHEAIVDAMERRAAAEVAELNSRWHWAFYRSAGSPRLEDHIARLWEAFPWRIFGSLPGSAEHTVVEHAAIMKAAYERNAQQAAKLLASHILRGRATLLARISELNQTAEPMA